MGAARRRSRGHGPARLDGTRPRATVASKVMESGKMAGQATATSTADRTASEARRPEAGSRAGGVSRAARGDDGSPKGRDLRSEARCNARQRDRPSPRWLGMPSLQGLLQKLMRQSSENRLDSDCCALGMAKTALDAAERMAASHGMFDQAMCVSKKTNVTN